MMDIQQLSVYNYDYNINFKSLCVIAGAGSGKTTTIINKIIKMINEENCNPNEFFITTFTRNAAKELIDRLKKKLDIFIVDKMIIGTFHSIAYKFLNKYELNNSKYVSSFDKLLYDYLQLIKTDKYIKSHKYIFIDEFQDIDEIQFEIINVLKINSKLLIVIGDDQQNIYTFRGSNIKYILNFEGDILKLETNYRCFPAIVRVSNYLLSYNQNKIDKTFRSHKKNNTKIYLNRLEKSYPSKITNCVINKILTLIKEKKDISNYAVISRYKHHLNDIENKLARLNIKSAYLETKLDNELYKSQNNRIVLTTIHGTKGLEFNGVFFIDFDYIKRTDSDIEEERRLYYVAITRAINGLMIIIEDCPSIFLTEIFMKSYENNDLFDNFNIDMINLKKSATIEDKSNIITISNVINKFNWINMIKINKIINFIDNEFEDITIHSNISELKDNKYKNNELITNFNFLIGNIVENYIQYILSLDTEEHFSYSLIENIIAYNRKQLYKGKEKYEKLLKNYYKIDIEFDIYEYYLDNKEYIDYLDKYNKDNRNVEFKYDRTKSNYTEEFVKNCTESYLKLFNKTGSMNDIIIYSINESILDTKRYALQTINVDKISKLFKCADKLKIFVEYIKSLNYKNYYIERSLIYNNILGRADIILENDDLFFIIDIKAIQQDKPDIKYVLQVLLYSCMYMIETNKIFNKIGIYSAIYGKLFIWNILDVNLEKVNQFLNEVINHN